MITMQFPVEEIPGLQIIAPDNFRDFRGEYVETWNKRDWDFDVEFIQDDISCSSRHVLRGLHGDQTTWKLVQCLYGELYLAVVDCRKDNKGEWFGIVLDDYSRRQVLIPPKCANGHLCISERCIFAYKQSTFYEDQKQFTLAWDSCGISWPIEKPPLLSERDKNGKKLEDIWIDD